MKPRYLFLLKLLGYSFILYIIGHKLLYAYASSIADGLTVQDLRYHLPPNIDKMIYGYSMTIIAFLSLTLATPKIPILKKAGFIAVRMAAFILSDFFFIQYIKGDASLTPDSVVYELYLCIKWLLPFLLWIVMSYSHLGKLLVVTSKSSRGLIVEQSPAKQLWVSIDYHSFPSRELLRSRR